MDETIAETEIDCASDIAQEMFGCGDLSMSPLGVEMSQFIGSKSDVELLELHIAWYQQDFDKEKSCMLGILHRMGHRDDSQDP